MVEQSMKSYGFRVRYFETDRYGVVYHSHYFHWFEVGRAEFMRDLGIPYHEWEEAGFYLPVAECGCKYIAPFHYDEKVKIAVSVQVLRRTSVRFKYSVFNFDGILAAEGFTLHACLNGEGKVVRIPEQYSRVLSR